MTRFWHGGVPNLQVGDQVLPPDLTGTQRTLSAYASPGAPHGTRTDRVYVTDDRQIARVYAALYPDGALYQVAPEDDLRTDPDAPGRSWMCPGAVVVRVADPVVLMRTRPVAAWLRVLTRERAS